MKWFRLYSSVLNDPKVQQLPPEVFKHWINLLCVASENTPRGELPPLDDLAFALRIRRSTCEKLLKKLAEAGLIEETFPEVSGDFSQSFPRVSIHNWEQRQRESDNIAARVEKHRRRKHAESDAGAIRNVTLQVTEVKRSVDTDTETDTDEETLSVSGKIDINTADADAPAPARAASASAAAEDRNEWTELEARRLAKRIAGRLRLTNPDIEALMAVLRQHRYAPAWLEAEAATCVEWYSAKKRKIDLRLFNNWLAKAEQRHREAALQEASLSNGHQHHTITTAATTTTGTDGITSSPDPGDALYQFNVERARQRARAKLVQ